MRRLGAGLYLLLTLACILAVAWLASFHAAAQITIGSVRGVPFVLDYDGDGRADTALYKGNGRWLLRRAAVGYADPYWQVRWGSDATGDLPLVGDFDGDGRDDLAVFRSTTGCIMALVIAGPHTGQQIKAGIDELNNPCW